MNEFKEDGDSRERDEGGCACGGHRPAIPGSTGDGPRPTWAVAPAARHTLDARPMIAAGEHPAAQVMALLEAIKDEEVLELLTPFVPEPLIERVRGRGYAAHTVVEELGLARTFFRKERA